MTEIVRRSFCKKKKQKKKKSVIGRKKVDCFMIFHDKKYYYYIFVIIFVVPEDIRDVRSTLVDLLTMPELTAQLLQLLPREIERE